MFGTQWFQTLVSGTPVRTLQPLLQMEEQAHVVTPGERGS